MHYSRTIFMAGYGRLPQGTAAKNLHEALTITAEIDEKHGVILELNCTLVTELGRQFIARLLRGFSLEDDLDEVIDCIQRYYKGKAGGAIIAALKDLVHQYQNIKTP